MKQYMTWDKNTPIVDGHSFVFTISPDGHNAPRREYFHLYVKFDNKLLHLGRSGDHLSVLYNGCLVEGGAIYSFWPAFAKERNLVIKLDRTSSKIISIYVNDKYIADVLISAKAERAWIEDGNGLRSTSILTIFEECECDMATAFAEAMRIPEAAYFKDLHDSTTPKRVPVGQVDVAADSGSGKGVVDQEKVKKEGKYGAEYEEALMDRAAAAANREKMLADQEKAAADRQKALVDREAAVAYREKILADQEKSMMNREKGAANWEKVVACREKVVARREKVLEGRETAVAAREMAIGAREQALDDFDGDGNDPVS